MNENITLPTMMIPAPWARRREAVPGASAEPEELDAGVVICEGLNGLPPRLPVGRAGYGYESSPVTIRVRRTPPGRASCTTRHAQCPDPPYDPGLPRV